MPFATFLHFMKASLRYVAASGSLAIAALCFAGCDKNGNNGPNGTGTGQTTVTGATPGGVNGSTGTITGADAATGAPGGGTGSAAVYPGGPGANSTTSSDRSTGASGGGAGGKVPGADTAASPNAGPATEPETKKPPHD